MVIIKLQDGILFFADDTFLKIAALASKEIVLPYPLKRLPAVAAFVALSRDFL
jgi:hypothetical protein